MKNPKATKNNERGNVESAHGEMPMVQVGRDFRMGRFAEWLHGPKGELMLVRTCEEFIGGRWETFISINERGAPEAA